ncbi:hypothetical protein NQ315_008945 [Exocentrus adspersus]|uniref:PiggyBac transposable element-derived protein domain-containing protein n=1 Tax=Exocentrus adspersus TaxID=1586481 RepID=A0AAV8V8N5_9CUCU|nr:hypothetical protein NQ315_008945 [Exocentrus adspersus]
MAYVVVEFTEGGTLAVVFNEWLTPRKSEVFWPPYEDQKKYNRALKEKQEIMNNFSKKVLTDEDLLRYLENDEDSDLPILSDDDENNEVENHIESFDEITNYINTTSHSDEENVEVNDQLEELQGGSRNYINENEENVPITENTNNVENIRNFYESHQLTNKNEVSWMGNVQYETRKVQWFEPVQEHVVDLPAPIEFFKKYIPDHIFTQMSEKTNLYAIQKNIARFPPTTPEEIKKFFGIHIVMGNLQFPRVRMYWQKNIGIPLVQENMAFNRFSKLRQTVHLVDVNDRQGTVDRLWKVRDLYNSIRQRCQELPMETFLCVDEQMVPFKGQINIKQYIKNKPKKWGIKIFVLAGQSGLIYDFVIYQGSTTELNPIYSHFGLGAGIVMQLCDRITEKGHGLFFDNYFSTYHLLQYLQSKDIFAVGTIRINRFLHPVLPTDKNLKSLGRGSSEVSVSKDGIVITKWFDNKPVLVASNFVGIGTKDVCKRWDKASKNYIEVPRPESIKYYNNNMGGVDKVDFLLSIYRSYVRSKKWTIRMITHAVDIALVNSWLEYRSKAMELGVQKKYILDLLSFRQEVAEHLILHKDPPKKGQTIKRGTTCNNN